MGAMIVLITPALNAIHKYCRNTMRFQRFSLLAIEVIHDVVFFQWAPIHPGYVLGDSAGPKLVGITHYDNPQTLKCLRVYLLTWFRNKPP